MMKTIPFTLGSTFESDTIYTCAGGDYHIYREHTQPGIFGAYALPVPVPVDAAFVFRDLKNVILDLGGAHLVFHGRIEPFVLENCENITLRNFSIDYDRPFYTQGEILEADAGHIKLRISESFTYRIEGNNLVFYGDGWENRLNKNVVLFQPFDPITKAPCYGSGCMLGYIGDGIEIQRDLPMAPCCLTADDGGDGTVILRGAIPGFLRTGQILTMSHEDRDKHGIFANECRNVVFEDIRMLHVPSFGIVAKFTENVTVRRVNMFIDEQSRGLITINADSVHCFACTGRVLIEDCIFENMLDDAVNIHSNYTIVNAIGENTLELQLPQQNCFGLNLYRPGDRILIYNGRTQELCGNCMVVSSELVSNDRIHAVISDMEGEISTGDTVDNPERAPEIEIRRCRTGNNRPRGFLLSSGKRILVENCLFYNSSIAIHFTGDKTFWYESGPVGNVTIRNCHFQNCGYAGGDWAIMATPSFESTKNVIFFHKNITVTDNIFETFTGGALFTEYTKNVTYAHNTVIMTDAYPRRGPVEEVVLKNSTGTINNVQVTL